MVQWIARSCRQRGVRLAVISRGYGAEAGAASDEALQLEQNLPDVPHLENPDRVEAARLAIEQYGTQLIVLDDAFQHRRIHRDLDVVMLDALEPFGYGHVFPRGTLREPLSGLRRADAVVLSRADMLEPDQRDGIRDEVRRHAPHAVWAEVASAPRALLSSSGREEAIDTLQGQPVAAFCGIGNPAGFRYTLERCGCRAVAFREFPDHHRYGRADIESLADWANQCDVMAVLCTHKDLVKLRVDQLGRRPLWAVTIGLEFLSGRTELETKLDALTPRNG